MEDIRLKMWRPWYFVLPDEEVVYFTKKAIVSNNEHFVRGLNVKAALLTTDLIYNAMKHGHGRTES